MQQSEPNKKIKDLIDKHLTHHPDSFLNLLNAFNKLDFPLFAINNDLEVIFANHAFNRITDEHHLDSISNLNDLKNRESIKSILDKNNSISFSLIFSNTKQLSNFHLFESNIHANKNIYRIIYCSSNNKQTDYYQYKLLVDQLGFGVGYYTPDGTVISYNNVAAKNIGGRPEDYSGKSLYDLFPKNLADEYLNRINVCLKSKESLSYIDKVPLPTSTMWFKSTYNKVKNKKNEVIGVQIVSDNITNEKKLEKRNNSLSRAIENSLNGFCIVDSEFKFTYANTTYLKMWGYNSLEDILGTSPKGHCSDPDIALNIKQKVDELGIYTTDFNAKRKDGSLFEARIYIRKEIDEEGNNIYPSSVIDVRDRQLAINNLIESETKFRAFIDHATDGVVIVDENAKVSFVNSAFCKILNIKKSKILNSYGWDLIYAMSNRPGKNESFKEQLKQRILHLLSSREDIEIAKNQTNIIQNKTGEIIDVIESVFVYSTSNGKNIGVFLRDISDIIQTEKEMHSAYDLLSETEKIAKSGSWTFNPLTNEGSWSKGSYAIRGASSELIGNTKNHESFMHPDDIESYRNQFQKNLLTSKNEFKQYYRLIDSKKNIKHIEAHYEVKRDDSGNAIFITGIDKDVTELYDAKTNLELSDERFSLAMQATKDGIWDWDIITNEVYFSPGWKRMLGYEENELENKFSVWEELLKPEDKAKSLQRIHNHLKGKSTRFENQFKMRHKNGHYIDILSRANAVFNHEGKTIRLVGTHVDITENLKAKKALEKSEETLRLALASGSQGIYDLNIQTGIAETNDNYAKMLDYNPKTFKETNSFWIERLHPDDTERTTTIYKQYISGEIPEYKVEFRQKTSKNKWKWILSYGKIVEYDEQGNPLRMLGTHTDINELKKAQEQLIDSEEKYKALYMNAPLAYQSLNITGRIIDVNPQWLKTLEYERDEVIGKNFAEFLNKKSKEHFKINFPKFKKAGHVSDVRFNMITKSGNEIIVSFEGCIGYTKTGKFRQTYCTFKEITSEVIANDMLLDASKAIEISERKFRELFEKSGDAVFILEGNKISNGNLASVELFGFESFDELKNKMPSDLSPTFQDNFQNSQELMNKVIEEAIKKGTNRFEWIHKNKNNKNFPCEILLTYLGKNEDDELMIHAVIRDITQRKREELELLDAKNKAEESDRLKSAFLANMSHEIRTPMNGIMGFAELLKEPQLEEEEIKQYVSVIERSGKRMLNIINDLIDISKIEARQMEVLLEETNINVQLTYLKTFFKPEAHKKNIELKVHTPLSNAEATIVSDREKIYAILTNLIKNSVKYTKEGSIEFGYTNKDSFLEFFVKDTGIGIPEEKQANIFERFVQAEMTHNREFEGAGLGLAISKAYVEMLGGKIWIKQSDENGTEFRFHIPK